VVHSGPEQATKTGVDEAESPDPLGMNPTDGFEVKQESLEVIEERRSKSVSNKVKSSHRRLYTDGEVSLISSFHNFS
jgi:hypothetical protein